MTFPYPALEVFDESVLATAADLTDWYWDESQLLRLDSTHLLLIYSVNSTYAAFDRYPGGTVFCLFAQRLTRDPVTHAVTHEGDPIHVVGRPDLDGYGPNPLPTTEPPYDSQTGENYPSAPAYAPWINFYYWHADAVDADTVLVRLHDFDGYFDPYPGRGLIHRYGPESEFRDSAFDLFVDFGWASTVQFTVTFDWVAGTSSKGTASRVAPGGVGATDPQQYDSEHNLIWAEHATYEDQYEGPWSGSPGGRWLGTTVMLTATRGVTTFPNTGVATYETGDPPYSDYQYYNWEICASSFDVNLDGSTTHLDFHMLTSPHAYPDARFNYGHHSVSWDNSELWQTVRMTDTRFVLFTTPTPELVPPDTSTFGQPLHCYVFDVDAVTGAVTLSGHAYVGDSSEGTFVDGVKFSCAKVRDDRVLIVMPNDWPTRPSDELWTVYVPPAGDPTWSVYVSEEFSHPDERNYADVGGDVYTVEKDSPILVSDGAGNWVAGWVGQGTADDSFYFGGGFVEADGTGTYSPVAAVPSWESLLETVPDPATGGHYRHTKGKQLDWLDDGVWSEDGLRAAFYAETFTYEEEYTYDPTRVPATIYTIDEDDNHREAYAVEVVEGDPPPPPPPPVVVHNPGELPASPVFVVEGASGVLLRNDSVPGAPSVKLVQAPAGTVVDFENRTVTGPGGVDRYLYVLQPVNWWKLTPGANHLEVFADSATLTFKPTWL